MQWQNKLAKNMGGKREQPCLVFGLQPNVSFCSFQLQPRIFISVHPKFFKTTCIIFLGELEKCCFKKHLSNVVKKPLTICVGMYTK